ncbi:GNAT family N-acetyltransferase [Microbacterium sp. CIAB417]|uniref:GNAT family N-acetyltransferase n=1 Tax=Microbacterium sp. CIAB417 TaxID=2860287 RepID=UPI001FAC056A|nr:GNAT family N-acetyltransferase [Microbacterium sp. CIAB417]
MQFEPGDRRRRLPRHLRQPEPEPDVFAYTIRPATARDLPDVREIYNHYVSNSVVTFDDKGSSHRYWREKFATLSKLGLPFLVAVAPSGNVIGYALVSPWQGKNSYRYTVEDSIYLGPGAGGKGLGTALLQALIDACEAIGLREIMAVISDSSAEASIRLHRRLGFVEVGRMGRVGYKFGRSIGSVYLQRKLRPRGRRWGSRSPR